MAAIAASLFSYGVQNLVRDSTRPGSSAMPSRSGSGSSSAQVSPASLLLSKMQQLRNQDSTTFKQLMGDASTQLKQAAQNAKGKDVSSLNDLAGKFQKAINGDLSGFQPSSRSPQTASGAYSQNSQPLHRSSSDSITGQVLAQVSAQIQSALIAY